MKCEVTIIDDLSMYIEVLTGSPKAIAQRIARTHGALQAQVNDGVIVSYTILTEFDDAGVVK